MLNLPLAWMLAAMVATTAASLGGARLYVPGPMRSIMVAIIGVLLGASFAAAPEPFRVHARVFERPPAGLQHQPLLGVEQLRFHRGDAEERGVELVEPVGRAPSGETGPGGPTSSTSAVSCPWSKACASAPETRSTERKSSRATTSPASIETAFPAFAETVGLSCPVTESRVFIEPVGASCRPAQPSDGPRGPRRERVSRSVRHSQALHLGRGAEAVVQTHEVEVPGDLLLDQDGRGELSRVGGLQSVACQQRVRSGPDRKHFGDFVPTASERDQPPEHFTALASRQRSFVRPSLDCTDDFGQCPYPGDDAIIFAEPLAHQLAVRLGSQQGDERGCVPVPHTRSARSSDNASEMLADSSSGGSSRMAAAPPLPGRSRPARIKRSRAP